MPATRRILVILDFTVTLGRKIFHGVSTYAQSHGPWELVLGSSAVLEGAGAGRFEGAIAHLGSPETVGLIERIGLPVVNTSNLRLDLTVPRVASDDAAVGQLAAEYFLNRGFQRFAYVGFCGHGYSMLRQMGFAQRLMEAGYEAQVYSLSGKVSGTKQVAKALRPATALLSCNDRCARSVLDACMQVGLKVPEDVAIMGVDNDEIMCEGFQPRLSSVELSTRLIGFRAAQWLEAMLAGETTLAASHGQQVLLPPEGIVTRQSTDHLAVDDPVVADAVRFIAERIKEGVDVHRVARAVHVSRRALERRFHRALGRGPGCEIRRIQIDRTKALLSGTDLTMTEVADAAGFSSAKQLSETFTREVGLAPTAYRRQFRH